MIGSPRAVLAAASAAQASVSVVAFGLPAIGPDLRDAYGLSLPMLGAALAANIFGSGVFLIAAGFLVDRFGARAFDARRNRDRGRRARRGRLRPRTRGARGPPLPLGGRVFGRSDSRHAGALRRLRGRPARLGVRGPADGGTPRRNGGCDPPAGARRSWRDPPRTHRERAPRLDRRPRLRCRRGRRRAEGPALVLRPSSALAHARDAAAASRRGPLHRRSPGSRGVYGSGRSGGGVLAPGCRNGFRPC